MAWNLVEWKGAQMVAKKVVQKVECWVCWKVEWKVWNLVEWKDAQMVE